MYLESCGSYETDPFEDGTKVDTSTRCITPDKLCRSPVKGGDMRNLILRDRIFQARKVIKHQLTKDDRGIFVIPASVFRCFLDLIAKDAGLILDDGGARTVWNGHTLDAFGQREQKATYIVRSGVGYFIRFEGERGIPLLNTDPVSASRVTRNKAIEIVEHLRRLGWEGELVEVVFGRMEEVGE